MIKEFLILLIILFRSTSPEALIIDREAGRQRLHPIRRRRLQGEPARPGGYNPGSRRIYQPRSTLLRQLESRGLGGSLRVRQVRSVLARRSHHR